MVDAQMVQAQSNQPPPSFNTMRKFFFFSFLTLNMMVNYDAGAVPACLDSIEIENTKLDFKHQGPLQGFVYLGLALGSPLCGVLLHKYSAKMVLLWSLVINIIACFGFAAAVSYWQLMVPRFIVGFSQAALVVYGPVWVDSFAPKNVMGAWMAAMQISAPVGVVVGYIVSGALTSQGIHWRYAFLIQAILLCPFIFLFLCLDSRYMNSDSEWALRGDQSAAEPQEKVQQKLQLARRDSWSSLHPVVLSSGSFRKTSSVMQVETGGWIGAEHATPQPEVKNNSTEEAGLKEIWQATRDLLANRIFMLSVFSLSFLFFVVTGVQTYATQYIVEELNTSKRTAVIVFGCVSITGAASGCVLGGYLVDRLGGYENHVVTSKLCVRLAFFAFIFSAPSGFVPELWQCAVCFWLMLLFGGAILPASYGLVISCVPLHLRSLTSSVSMGIYTIFGYAFAPIVIGMIMDATSLAWGFRAVSLWGGLGVLGWVAVYWSVTHSDGPKGRGQWVEMADTN